MYAIQLPDGQFLQLNPGQQFSFNLQSSVRSAADIGELPGSFSFPADLPNTPENRRKLGFPDNVHSVNVKWSIPDVWVYAGGVPFFLGSLTVRAAAPSGISIYLVADTLSDLKSAYLPDLDWGSPFSVGSTTAAGWAAHMLLTAQSPENFQHIFFPVISQGVGWYNKFTGAAFDTSSEAFTPFLKLDFVLSKVFAALANGFSFENRWQIDSELKRRVLFNNADVRVLTAVPTNAPVFPSVIRYERHVPRVTVAELLRKVCAVHALGLFTNVFSKTIRLAPMSSIIGRAAVLDWTKYAVGKPTIEPKDSDVPAYFNYKNPYESDRPKHFPAPEKANLRVRTVAELNSHISAFPSVPFARFIYCEEGETLFELANDGVATWVIAAHPIWAGVGEASGKAFEVGVTPMRGYSGDYVSLAPPSRYENNGAGTPYAWKSNSYEFSFMQYRGIQSDGKPHAANHVWMPGTTNGTRTQVAGADSKYSLNWDGQFGLYQTAWQGWHAALSEGRHVKQSFLLPTKAVIDFSFEQKVRVGGMEYIIKSLQVSRLHQGGIFEAEANLISIL